MMTRTLVKFTVILGLICLLMGGGVAVLYGVWRDQIAERERAATQAAMLAVAPEGAEVDTATPIAGSPGDSAAVYAARDPSGKTVGYVAGGGAQGYGGVVRVIVGAKATDLQIVAVVVVSHTETPGLGAHVAEHLSTYTLWQKLFGADEAERFISPFLDRFRGKRRNEIPDIQAITAATITSNATKAAVAQALDRIRDARKEAP
jgi:electron transport complex protein RnfG